MQMTAVDAPKHVAEIYFRPGASPVYRVTNTTSLVWVPMSTRVACEALRRGVLHGFAAVRVESMQ